MCVNRVKASLLRSWYVRVHQYIHELPWRAHMQRRDNAYWKRDRNTYHVSLELWVSSRRWECMKRRRRCISKLLKITHIYTIRTHRQHARARARTHIEQGS